MARHQMTAEAVGKLQRLFQIDRARTIEPGGAAQRLARHIEAERRPIDGDDRQAAAADGEAVADAQVRHVERAGDERQRESIGRGFRRRDAADRLHDAGEHQRTTLARMRQSVPTGSTPTMRNGVR